MAEIVVDDRERADRVVETLKAAERVQFRVARLLCGDYLVANVCGIERKTAEDFARSVVDGRLFRQMGAMRRRYPRPVLIVEGLKPERDVQNVAWPALQGALVSVSAAFGVPVLRARGPEETAGLILTAARQLERGFTDGYTRPGYRPKGWRRRALFVLQGLPRVGPRRAASLLDRFGCVRAIANASEEALAEARGVGPSVARRILRAFGAEDAERSGRAPRPGAGRMLSCWGAAASPPAGRAAPGFANPEVAMPMPPMYPQDLVQPLRDELTSIGFEELRAPEEVDRAVRETRGTLLVFINSVCGCAAGSARPAAAMALNNRVVPDRLVTVFAGMEREAVERVRELHKNLAPPSSPSIALFKDGRPVRVIERREIEGRSPQQVAESLAALFNETCARPGPAIPPGSPAPQPPAPPGGPSFVKFPR